MASLRTLLTALLVPDTAVVSQATTALRTRLKSRAALGELIGLLADADGSIRQLAAVLMRRALPSRLPSFSDAERAAARAAVFAALSAEQAAAPRTALVALAAAVAAATAEWPELAAAALSGQAGGLQTVCALADAAPGPLLSSLPALTSLLGQALAARAPHAVPALVASLRSAAVVDSDAFPALLGLLPSLADAVRAHAATAPASDGFADAVADAFECCTLGSEAGGEAMKAFFPGSVQLAVEIFSARAAADKARAAAGEYLMFAAVHKPKTFRKLGIATPVLTTACEVAAQHRCPEEAGDEEADEEERPSDVALRVLDTMARRPELSDVVFGAALAAAAALLERAAVDEKPADKSAHAAVAFRVTGSVAEGCAVQVTAHAADIVDKVAAGARDETLAPSARADALQALTLVCDAFEAEEMPETVVSSVSGAALSALLAGIRHPVLAVRRHACLALEPVLSLCLADVASLQPRVAEIIGALSGMAGDAAVEAVMAIGILAENAPDEFVAYEGMGDLVQGTLALMARTGDDAMMARAAGIETAGALVAVCGNQAIIEQLAAIAVGGLEVDEPNVKRATYSFFARMADAVGGSVVAAYGPKVLKAALESIQRDDVVYEPDEEDAGGLADIASAVADSEDVTDGNNTGEEDPAFGTFHVRTAFLDEKMLAVAVVGAFAAATDNAAYVSAAERVPAHAKETQKLLSRAGNLVDGLAIYFHEDVRAAANKAVVRMAIANVRLTDICPALKFDDGEVVGTAAQRVAYAIEEDDDAWVVANVLASAVMLCDELPPAMVAEHKGNLLHPLEALIDGSATCQAGAEEDEEGDGGMEDGGSEQASLISGIGDLVEAMARSQRGLFAKDFAGLFSKLIKSLCGPSSPGRTKGVVLGAVAGVLLFLGWERCAKFNPPAAGSPDYVAAGKVADEVAGAVLPMALAALAEGEGATLQRNAVFLVGVVFGRASAGNAAVWGRLADATKLLEGILLREKTSDSATLIDNAAGAVARILTSPGLPAGALAGGESALRIMLGNIPMEGDPAENTTVARAVLKFMQKDLELVFRFVQPVASCLVSALLLAKHQMERDERPRFNGERDENDHMTRMDEGEVGQVAAALGVIRGRCGDEVFRGLGLSEGDAAVVAGAIGASGQ